MKFYLWWGWNPEWWDIAFNEQLSYITEILKKNNTKQLLHIPFARTGIRKRNRDAFSPNNLKSIITWLWIEYLDASYFEDIAAYNWDTIYINWGNNCEFLFEMCNHSELLHAIKKSKNIIGESCWAMIFWKNFENSKNIWQVWFGFIENTIIIPHYTEHNMYESGIKGQEQTWVSTILWIDEATFIEYEEWKYWKTLGRWKTYIL